MLWQRVEWMECSIPDRGNKYLFHFCFLFVWNCFPFTSSWLSVIWGWKQATLSDTFNLLLSVFTNKSYRDVSAENADEFNPKHLHLQCKFNMGWRRTVWPPKLPYFSTKAENLMGNSELKPNIIKARGTTWASDIFLCSVRGFSRSADSHQRERGRWW